MMFGTLVATAPTHAAWSSPSGHPAMDQPLALSISTAATAAHRWTETAGRQCHTGNQRAPLHRAAETNASGLTRSSSS